MSDDDVLAELLAKSSLATWSTTHGALKSCLGRIFAALWGVGYFGQERSVPQPQ